MFEEVSDGGEIIVLYHRSMDDRPYRCFSFQVQEVFVCHAVDVTKFCHSKFKCLLLTIAACDQILYVIAQVQFHFLHRSMIKSLVLSKGPEPLFYFLLKVKHHEVI